MDERSFLIGERKFKLSKIDTFKQHRVVKRISPILGEIIPVAQKLSKLKVSGMSQEEAFEAIVSTDGIRKILEGYSKLSDSDAEYVLLSLCSSVEVFQPQFGSWARVVANDQLMFEDIPLQMLYQIAGRAFIYNTAGFFGSAPQASPGRA
jgi:hypothetical protein